MAFQDFPLHETVLANLAEMGFTNPTDIQAQILPVALEGRDVSGLSRTGTGKTAAFLIPTIQRLLQLPEDRLALCLAPTRELAQQIEQEAKRISKGLNLGTVSVVGGMSSEDQIAALKKGARLVTGTPGRIIDLFKERELNLANVDVLVFDEADRMFDMGFIKDMHYILSKVNQKRQILLFSATMNFSVLNMVYEYGANPEEINVSRDMLTAEKIQQVLYHVGDREKAASLLAVCKKHSPENGSIIVFVNYKERVPWVAALLSRNGIPAQGLSSLLRQERRNKIIQGFKKGQFRALVATDVASRGLDVDDISLVVNYHLPEEAATYVHRIGRTARAGRHGIAVAICSSEDAYNQMRVEEFLGHKIPVEWLNDEDMPKDIQMPHRSDEREFSDEDEESEGEGQHRGRERHGRREGRDGRRDRGERPGRGERGHRAERSERPERSSHRAESPAPAAAETAPPQTTAGEAVQEAAPVREERRDHGHRGERHSRNETREGGERHARGERGDRGDRGERHGRPDREGRDRGRRGRGDRDRGDRHGRREGRDREFSQESTLDPASMPNPLTGNPIIYDMRTGKPKNRSPEEFRSFMADYNNRTQPAADKSSGVKKAAPAIIKKISSKVTALFGKRGE
jgi:ATP-dependent RNA helicase RhlE